MELIVVGLSHHTAPLALRERLTLLPEEIAKRLAALAASPAIAETAILSTCNRVEIYAAAPDAAAALVALRAHLRGDAGLEVDDHLYDRRGADMVAHLFRVVASLDSLVVGEPQILGQAKEALAEATAAGTVGPALGAVFQRAFRVARRVRRDTDIARKAVSVSSLAVEYARNVWSDFSGKQVLLLGAGKMSHLAARALASHGARVAVSNRTAERAQAIARELGFAVEEWGDLGGALGRADIVITSTGSRRPIVDVPMLRDVQRARRGRYLVIVDIAVPRDVDPAVDELEGVFRCDMDGLQALAAEHREARREEAARAETMVAEEVRRFLAGERGRAAGPVIVALRNRVTQIARAEAERTLSALPGAGERERKAVLALADAIAAKLLHAPQVALRKSAADSDEDLAAALRRLFDLGEIEPVSAPVEGADADDGAEEGHDAASGPPVAAKARTQ